MKKLVALIAFLSIASPVYATTTPILQVTGAPVKAGTRDQPAQNAGTDKAHRAQLSLKHFEKLRADEYRYWQSRPIHERVAAVSQLTQEQYALKGWKIEPMDNTLRRMQRDKDGNEPVS